MLDSETFICDPGFGQPLHMLLQESLQESLQRHLTLRLSL